MAYTSFSDNTIFTDNKINIYCNALIHYTTVTKDYQVLDLVLSGIPAVVLQGTTGIDAPVIPFVTSDSNLFNDLVKDLLNIFKTAQSITFRDSIRFYLGNYLFEIWLIDSFSTTTVFNIPVNDIKTIPLNLYDA
jgi:hypothetical protein